jgi:transposase
VSMTGNNAKGGVLHGPERRRRWAAAEKIAIVAETYEPGVTVSLVARRHGVAPNQVFSWRRLAAQGALTAAGSEEAVVPASDYRALQSQLREMQRLLGKTMEAEILREALELAGGQKKHLVRALSAPKDGIR